MAYCQIHYDNLNHRNRLVKLDESKFKRLQEAKDCRSQLGGDNIHLQGNNIPDLYDDNIKFEFHSECYKQFTKAISIYKNRTKKNNDRIKRSGENKSQLFPKHCMVCKKVTITFNRRKQHARFIELENAELAIRKAAEKKKDNFMLTAIQGVESLRAAEFRIHERCQKNYTNVNSPKKKRIRSEVNLEELDNEEHPKKRTAKNNEGMFICHF